MSFIGTVRPADATGEVRAMYERQEDYWGYVPNYAKAFSHRTEALARWGRLLAELRRPAGGGEAPGGPAKGGGDGPVPAPRVIALADPRYPAGDRSAAVAELRLRSLLAAGHRFESYSVSLGPETAEHADGRLRYVGVPAELVALMDVRQMDFDDRKVNGQQGVQ